MRVARGKERVVDQHEQRVRAFHTLKRFRHLRFGAGRHGARQAMHEYFGIHGGAEDAADGFELLTDLSGVREVAVMREGDVPTLEVHKGGLRILDGRRAGGGVARVADGR